MKRSESVMEWQAEAREEAQIQTRIEALLEVLRSRFGSELPTDLVQRIQSTADVDQLKHWLETAARARSLKKFRQTMDA